MLDTYCFNKLIIIKQNVLIVHCRIMRFFGILQDMLTWWILLMNGCTIAILLVTKNSKMLISVVLLQLMGPDGT